MQLERDAARAAAATNAKANNTRADVRPPCPAIDAPARLHASRTGRGSGDCKVKSLRLTFVSVALAAVLFLSACYAQSSPRIEIQRVNISVPMACNELEPERPVMLAENLSGNVDVDMYVQAAGAEIERCKGYETELRDVFANCKWPLKVAKKLKPLRWLWHRGGFLLYYFNGVLISAVVGFFGHGRREAFDHVYRGWTDVCGHQSEVSRIGAMIEQAVQTQ